MRNLMYVCLLLIPCLLTTCDISSFNWDLSKFATIETYLPDHILDVSAQSGGNISDDGGASVSERGICYGQSSNPTISHSKVVCGNGNGSFTAILVGLTANTTYYIRAYAITKVGIAYGNEVVFNTLSLSALTTTGVSSITYTTATSGGNISSNGGSAVTARGICYSMVSKPIITNTKVVSGSGNGNFTASMTGLSPGTIYYVRAYATNIVGTAYGNEVNFKTLALTLPTLSTTTVSPILSNSAVSGGTITSDGGSIVISRGICYGTVSNPTISSNRVVSGSGIGNYIATMNALSPSTTYYVRAYATNSVGTSYGNELSFKTAPIFTIGQSYQGGIIFYIDATSSHGLIAAPSDQSTGTIWGCSGTSIAGTSTSVGTGSANTTAIILGCSPTSIAARLCYNLVLSGFSDWYLPSLSELGLMYTNLKALNLGGFTNTYYWSSSQYSSTYGYLQSFSVNSYAVGSKSSAYRVRAIRSF